MILATVILLTLLCNWGVYQMLRPRHLTVVAPLIVAHSDDFTFDHRGLV